MKLKTLKSALQGAPASRLAILAARPQIVGRLRGGAGVRDRAKIKERDCGLCQECRRYGMGRPGSIVDHRIPLWDGGSDDGGNKQYLCRSCSDAKTKVEAGLRARGQSVPRPHGVVIPMDR